MGKHHMLWIAIASLLLSVNEGLFAVTTFPSESTTLYTNESVVIPFTLDKKSVERQEWKTTVSPPELAQILQPAQALPGQAIGYVRLLPKQPGEATLHVAGGNRLKLNILPSPPETAQLNWVSPLEGVALEGEVQVGIDLVLSNSRSELWKSAPPTLHIGSGEDARVIEASHTLKDRLPRSVRYIYHVNCNELASGLQPLTARWLPEGKPHESIQREVYIFNATSTRQLVSHQAEDLQEVRVTYINREKPQPLPKIIEDETAQEGKYALLPGNGNTIAFRLNVEHGGHYQVFTRARAPLAGGAHASMGIYLNDKDEPRTVTRTLSGEWHRIPVGKPLYIEAGEHTCSLRFTNDFRGPNKINRDLHIDQLSILKIPYEAPIAKQQARTLTVAFRDVIEGKNIQGPFRVRAQADFEGMKKQKKEYVFPEVSLWINGERVQHQVHSRPNFMVPPKALQRGKNQLQLKASLQGRTVASNIQTVVLDPMQQTIRAQPLRDIVFTSADANWENSSEQLKGIRSKLYGEPIFEFKKNHTATLNLPPSLEGEYRIFIAASSQYHQGHARAEVSLQSGDVSSPLSSLEVHYRREYEIGKVKLDGSSETSTQLQIAFTNELRKNKKQGRALRIHHVRLTPHREDVDTTDPSIAIQYPPANHKIWREDAVIAEVFDPSGIESIELLIDGERNMPAYRPQQHLGRIVLPVLAKEMTAGSRQLSLKLTDRKGNVTMSDPITVEILARAPAEAGHYHRALHLLNRLAYGPEPDQLSAILVDGEDAWLERSLVQRSLSNAESISHEISGFPRLPDSDYWVPRKALTQATLSQNPVKERFNFWVQNHFSTWIRKSRGDQKVREHLKFHHAGFDRFNRLLNISAHSPAMLVYLDQQRSFAKRINENYAREIMELHTLSVDGRYTQQDVTTLSRVLTGWMTSQQAYPDGRKGNPKIHEFQFEHRLNDPAPAQVVGLNLPEASDKDAAYDRIQTVLETLSRHPDTAHFISRKLAEHYMPLPAPESLVKTLEKTFHETGGDMQHMMQALVSHNTFWASMNQEKLATPLDYSIRIARIMNHYDTGSYHGFLQRSGMGLFERSTPDGYPEDPQAYADSNAMLQRWHLAKEIAHPIYNHIDRSWQIGKEPEKNGMTLAELTSFTITGSALDEQAEQALQELIATTDPKELWSPGLCALMLQLPQTQYR
ncbi:MAG: DUF1800 family protein [Verrucomicrobiota bacterium]